MAIANQGTAKAPPSQSRQADLKSGKHPEVKHPKVDDRAPMRKA